MFCKATLNIQKIIYKNEEEITGLSTISAKIIFLHITIRDTWCFHCKTMDTLLCYYYEFLFFCRPWDICMMAQWISENLCYLLNNSSSASNWRNWALVSEVTKRRIWIQWACEIRSRRSLGASPSYLTNNGKALLQTSNVPKSSKTRTEPDSIHKISLSNVFHFVSLHIFELLWQNTHITPSRSSRVGVTCAQQLTATLRHAITQHHTVQPQRER